MNPSIRLIASLVVLIPLLAACGQTTPPPSGTQLVSGTLSALSSNRSSLTVSGKTIALSASTAFKVNGQAVKLGILSVGQTVRVTASGSSATEVEVELELKGKIESIDAPNNSLVVASKTVKVDASTRIDLESDDDTASSTPHTIADLKVGDFVEVSGATDTSGAVQATKIEVKGAKELDDDGEDNDTELKGTVSGFTAGGTSFTLGTITVNCTGSCVLPTGLKNGDFVEVEGALSGTTLTARKVKLEDEHGDDDHVDPPAGSSVTLEGRAKDLSTGAKTFQLEGFTVDYASATMTGNALNDHSRVKVEGTVDASNRKLVHASSVNVVGYY